MLYSRTHLRPWRRLLPLLILAFALAPSRAAETNSVTTPNVTVNGKPLPVETSAAELAVTEAAPTPATSAIPTAPTPAILPVASPTPAPAITVADLPVADDAKEKPITETPQLVDAPLTADAALLDAPPVDLSPAPTPSQNVTINLINRLVKKGVLSKDEAEELIAQAEADAAMAQAQAEATQFAVDQATAAQVAAIQGIPAPITDDTVRVTYVPEVVKTEIREQIKQEVITKAKEEGWIAQNVMPSWVSKIKPFGDIRVRWESDFFPKGNDNSGAFPNFNAINTGAPFDVSGTQFSPQYNVDQNRNRLRLRARLGADVNLGEHFSTGFRIATGENNSPVTANQSLGLPTSGQGGNFSKYAIWLDRAFIKYELTGVPSRELRALVGRFDNPFFTTTNIQWSDDIGFDGIAIQGNYQIVNGFTPFLNAGIFPVYNTDFNFSSNQPSKFKSYDKWLYAIQAGSEWKITKDIKFKSAIAYYYFQNIEGKLSSPYVPLNASDASDTDNSRPSFAQKGNTYMAIRNIIPDASNDFGTINQYQYFGLATPYQNLTLAGKLDFTHFEPFIISLSAEYVRNLAWDQGSINAIAVNNRGPNDDSFSDSNSFGNYAGGANAFNVQLQVGSAALIKRGNWNASVGYRYVESDAVVDGFTSSDFGGGGTNLKGYTLAANYSLSANVWLGIRWMSGQSIAGPTYKEDILQFDINAKF